MHSDYIQSDIKLTIGMLVSNRKQYIRNAMEALKPLLEAVSSELIVVDTKGMDSDGSIDIVREYTNQIYPFTWCNDFAAARNVCLEHAKGEWFLFQDDDEVFDDVKELIDFFQSDEYKKYGSGYYHVKNHFAGGGYSMGIVGRMVRITKQTRFEGAVHEHFNVVSEPHKVFSCFVHHYGYVFHNEEERKKHQERNVTLLKKELTIHGMTPQLCAQMVQELFSCKDTREAGYNFCIKSIKELQKKGWLLDACSQWLLVASVRYFKMKKDYRGILSQAQIIREQYPLSQMAWLALAGVVIETSAPEGNVRVILEYAPFYMEAWDWLNGHPKEAITQNQLDLSDYRTQDYAIQVFQAAATCANAIQKYEEANEYWNHIPWDKDGFDGTPYYAGVKETKRGLELQKVLKQQERQKKENELFELMAVIEEAKPVIRVLLEEGKEQQVVELLTTMQEVIITLGNKTEQCYGECMEVSELISLLENCCELIWKCANADKEDALKIYHMLNEKLCSANKRLRDIKMGNSVLI